MTPQQQALMIRVLRYIVAHPKEHHQDTYGLKGECGTTFCFAGHVALALGWKPMWQDDGHLAQVVRDGDEESFPDEVATEALGLDMQQRFDLFYSAGTVEDLRGLATGYLGFDPMGPVADQLLEGVPA